MEPKKLKKLRLSLIVKGKNLIKVENNKQMDGIQKISDFMNPPVKNKIIK